MGVLGATSSRTTAPKRRRRTSCSIVARRSDGLVLLDLDVGVPRHAEEVRGDDLETREELAEVRLDERLEEEELGLLGPDLLLPFHDLAERDEARESRRGP